MDNTTNSLAEKSRLRQMIDSYGVPRMIITGFLLLMFVLVPFAGVDFATQISNVINRFSWNAIMVLAMVPMVHSGCGLNFGLPLGIISGLLGATLSIELGFTGPMSFVMAIVIATPFALLLGSAGALFAMRVFHHKTRHWYFKFGIPAILLAQIAAGVFVYVRFFAA